MCTNYSVIIQNELYVYMSVNWTIPLSDAHMVQLMAKFPVTLMRCMSLSKFKKHAIYFQVHRSCTSELNAC